MDLAFFNPGYYVRIAPGNGDGTFGTVVSYLIAMDPAVAFTVGTIGNFNADFTTDLVVASLESGGYAVLLGNAVTPITIQTSPSGLQFTIDNAAPLTAPQTIDLTPGTHTITVASTQTGPGTRYLFSSWSDSPTASDTITVGTTAATYTASFQTQYQLTTASYPQAGGSVVPASGAYYNSGATVTLTATPNSPLVFTGWSDSVTSAFNPLQTTMNTPVSVTAIFDVPGPTCTMTGDATASVADAQFIVNEALGVIAANNDLNGDGMVNIVDVQQVIGAVLGLGCR